VKSSALMSSQTPRSFELVEALSDGDFILSPYLRHEIPRRSSIYAAAHRTRQRHTSRRMARRSEERNCVVEEHE